MDQFIELEPHHLDKTGVFHALLCDDLIKAAQAAVVRRKMRVKIVRMKDGKRTNILGADGTGDQDERKEPAKDHLYTDTKPPAYFSERTDLGGVWSQAMESVTPLASDEQAMPWAARRAPFSSAPDAFPQAV